VPASVIVIIIPVVVVIVDAECDTRSQYKVGKCRSTQLLNQSLTDKQLSVGDVM